VFSFKGKSFVLALALMFLFGLFSCSSKSYKNGVFSDDENSYRILPPSANWKQLNAEGADIAFFNEKLNAVIMLNSTCEKYKDAPASALSGHLVIGIEDKKVIEQEKIEVDGREAVYTVLEGMLDGASVKLVTLVLVKNYCIYDMAYSASPRNFKKGLPAFKKIMAKFKVLSRKGQ